MLRDLSWLKRVKLIDKDGNLIDTDNPLPIQSINLRKVNWTDDTDFDAGSLTNIERKEAGDNAYIQLAENVDNYDDIDFTTAGDYTFSDGTKIEIDSGILKLKPSSGTSQNYPFTTPSNYTISDAGALEIDGGVAKLIPVSDLTTDCEAFWKMNESSGTRYDSVGSNNLTDVNANVGNASGRVNNSARFDSTSDQLSIDDNASLSFGDEDMTIAFWLYLDSFSPSSHLVGKWGSGGLEYAIYLPSSGGPRLMVSYNGASQALVTSSPALSTGAWHFIVAWHDSVNDKLKIQVNLGTIYESNHTLGIYNGNRKFDVGTSATLGTNLNGRIDCLGIWRKVLSSGERSYLYNSGNGIEVLDVFPTTNPTVETDNGFAFSGTFTSFNATVSTPTGTNIKYILSLDNGSTWLYWDGASWTTSNETYSQSNTTAEVSDNIATIGSSGTLKIRAFLNSDDTDSPELDLIEISTVGNYPTDDNLYAETKDTSQIVPSTNLAWLSSLFTTTIQSDTDIKILFSNDGRTSWLTWNGSSWVTPADATQRQYAISIQDAQDNFTDLPVGDGTLDVRIFLKTDDSDNYCAVSNINVISETGYQTSGIYESEVYDSGYFSLDWGTVEFTLTLPIGTSIILKARASNDPNDLGDYGSALSNGIDSNVTGRYIQWQATFETTDSLTTSKLNETAFNFSFPLKREIRP